MECRYESDQGYQESGPAGALMAMAGWWVILMGWGPVRQAAPRPARSTRQRFADSKSQVAARWVPRKAPLEVAFPWMSTMASQSRGGNWTSIGITQG